MSSFGIVGGGLLGMTLALRLTRAGHHVTIFESAPTVGGLAAPWRLGDIEWDRHYHVTLASDTALREILRELDLERSLQWRTTRTGFYAGGRLYSLSSAAEFLRFPPLGLIQKARLAATILHAARVENWRALERLTAVEWLTKLSGRKTVEAIWYPLLRSKLGPNADKASAAFIWATIARLYAARRSGMKREQFGYVEGGYARILARYEEVLRSRGVRVLTGRTVQRVEHAGDALYVFTADNTPERFDRVVVTLASPLVPKLCPGLSERERELFAGVQYQGIVCASLLCDEPLSPYYVTNITDDWVPFTGVIEMSAFVDRSSFGGKSLIYLPKYMPSGDPALQSRDEDVEREFLGALERMYPAFQRSCVRAFRISRVRYVFPIPTLGYSDRLPPVQTSIPGLYAANSTHIVNGTLNVNETVQLANRVAEQLVAQPAPESAAVAV